MSGQITLYEAADEYIAVLDNVDPDTGELPPEFGDVHALVTTKAAAVAAYILNSESHVQMVEAAANRLAAKAHAMDRRAEHLRTYLRLHMARTGITEIKANDGTFKIQLQRERDVRVEVFEPATVPAQYLRQPPIPTPQPDKAAIKKTIESGVDVPGARIVKNDRLVIS